MGVLVRVVDGQLQKRDYNVADVLRCLTNIAGPREVRTQLEFVEDQIKMVIDDEKLSYSGKNTLIKVVKILKDIRLDLAEVGNFIHGTTVCS